jgi:hypothetical protein
MKASLELASCFPGSLFAFAFAFAVVFFFFSFLGWGRG